LGKGTEDVDMTRISHQFHNAILSNTRYWQLLVNWKQMHFNFNYLCSAWIHQRKRYVQICDRLTNL